LVVVGVAGEGILCLFEEIGHVCGLGVGLERSEVTELFFEVFGYSVDCARKLTQTAEKSTL